MRQLQKLSRRWNISLLIILVVLVECLSAVDPKCSTSIVSDGIGSLICEGINNNNLDLVTSQLDTMKANDLLVNLELRQSAVDNLHSEFLTGYPIRSLTFFDDGLVSIPHNILKNIDSPLIVLDLSNNIIGEVKEHNFQNLSFSDSLEILILSNNQLTDLPEKNIFQAFPNLRKLLLPFNNIEKLKSNTFADLNELTDLQLYANEIRHIAIDAFGTLPKLARLYLNQNKIASLDNDTFSIDIFPSLIRIYLGNNPFQCNCSLEWFKLWLQNRDLIFESDATCKYPDREPFAFVDFCPQRVPLRALTWIHGTRKLYMKYVDEVIMQDPRERQFRTEHNIRHNF